MNFRATRMLTASFAVAAAAALTGVPAQAAAPESPDPIKIAPFGPWRRTPSSPRQRSCPSTPRRP